MATTLAHPVQWVVGAPLWGPTPEKLLRLRQPAILEFDSDRFMEELAEKLQAQERPDLTGLRVPATAANTPPRKLYQPAHGRFYLVATSLVCRLPGLPDHVVDTAKGERAAFVLRRLATDGTEEAWVPASSTPGEKRRMWSRQEGVKAEALATGEELMPLFPVNYSSEGKRRRLLVGLVPTSSRDTFESAGSFSAPAADEDDMLTSEAEAQVAGPYEQLKLWKDLDDPTEQAEQLQQQREVSRFLLLDFARFIQERMQDFWSVLDDTVSPGGVRGTLWTELNKAADATAGTKWRVALQTAWTQRAQIEAGETGGLTLNLRTSPVVPATLRSALMAVVKAEGKYTLPQGAPEPSPKLEAPDETRYVLRCVYLKPACGKLCPPLVSVPTAPFRLAAFFDVEAPARPIRIELPLKTGIAHLRKARKSVGFVLSKELRKQMSRVVDLKKTMDGELGAAKSFDLGELCMFSIPIITLCAFIVLMIFLSLLNIIFWWLPFLKICLPKVKVG